MKSLIPNIDVSISDRSGLNCTVPWYKFFEVVSVRIGFKDIGWTVGTGVPSKGAFAAYPGQIVGVGYVQAQAQATDNAVKAASQRLLAIEQALRAAKVID